jgi:hypothetical protein
VTQSRFEYFTTYSKQPSQLPRVENIRAIAGEGLIVVACAFAILGPGSEARDNRKWFVTHDSVLRYCMTAE